MDRLNGTPFFLAGLLCLYSAGLVLSPRFRHRDSRPRAAVKRVPVVGRILERLCADDPPLSKRLGAVLWVGMGTVAVLEGVVIFIAPASVK